MIRIQRLVQWAAASALTISLLPLGTAQANTRTVGVGAPFQEYYTKYQGIRVLGNPLAEMESVNKQPMQYFEKGRIEDHSKETSNPDWKFMYGRLTAEMMDRYPMASVNATGTTYGELKTAHTQKEPAPAGFKGGVKTMPDGGVFVPYDAQLRPASGFMIPNMFWSYLNRKDLFPGGWLHDVGLPMTHAHHATTVKNGKMRYITMQAFERAVLTFDGQNPREWQVERGNIGSDMYGQLKGGGPGNVEVGQYVTDQTRKFLRRAGENPSYAEVEYVDMLSNRARNLYVKGAVRGSNWVNNLLLTQANGGPPQCPDGNDVPCRITIHQVKGDRAQVSVQWTWVGAAEGYRLLSYVREGNDWKLDDVVGVDGTWDERLGGSLNMDVARFFFAWQSGDIAFARAMLSPELQQQAKDSAQIATMMGLRTTPKMVYVSLESELSARPRKGILRVSLAVPGSEMTSRRLEVSDKVGPQNVYAQITRVMP
jgi:hypothetical protein